MSSRKTKKTVELLSSLPGGIQARAETEVGSSTVDRLAWLVRLLNRSQEGISTTIEEKRRELEAQVIAFAKPVGRASGGKKSKLNWDEFQGLVQFFRASILGLMAGASFQVEVPDLTYQVTPDEPLIYLGAPHVIFRIAVAKLLETEQKRIRVCARAGCGNLFLRHKRGIYCSRQCSLLEYFRRYVDRHTSHEKDGG